MDDLIHRQEAKDAIDMALDHIDHVPPWVYDKLLNALNEVPSAEKAQLSGEDATSVCKCPCVANAPTIEPEPKPISYMECANAMLKMWIDNVLTDGEYNRIMDKLNSKHMADIRGEQE